VVSGAMLRCAKVIYSRVYYFNIISYNHRMRRDETIALLITRGLGGVIESTTITSS